MKKSVSVLLLIILTLTLCSACTPKDGGAANPAENLEIPSVQAPLRPEVKGATVLYEGENITVREWEETDENTFSMHISWALPDDELIYRNSPILFVGTVEKVTRITVDFLDQEQWRTLTLLFLVEIRPQRVLQDKDGFLKTKGETVTVLFDFMMSQGSPVELKPGKTLMLWTMAARDSDYATSAWADLRSSWNPEFPMEQVGDFYLADGYFKDYVSGGKTVYESLQWTEEIYQEYQELPMNEYPIDHPQWEKILKNVENPQETYELLKYVKTKEKVYGYNLKRHCLIPCDALEQAIRQRAELYQ